MKKQNGLSLVELLIAITLGLILMTGVIQMFLASRSVFSTQQGISRSQETGRLAIDFISRDSRMAAYYGCFRPSADLGDAGLLQNKTLSIGGLHKNFDQGVRGYDKAGDLPDGVSTDLGASIVPATNESILVLRGASQTGAVVNLTSAANIAYAYANSPIVNSCVGNLCDGTAMVISDCTKARVFKATALSKAGTTLSVSHTDAWSVTDGFSKGEILPMNTTVYFVAKGANGNYSLWQRINTDTAMELLEGVEKMYVTYSADGATYKNAAAVTAANEWDVINAIRVEVVVKSVDNNVVADVQPYKFKGVISTPAAKDFHMYQVFSTTINVRNHDGI